ncbi:MAG: oligosaccharide flippase family protein [Candidatus Omnitrophica bacterium]|nr:oligosaccharide flippase family protein [Candidatus Omnitrophota bacterium]
MKLKRIFFDDLTKDSLIMFLGSGFTNLCNLLYTIFLVRSLTPSDFGIFNSLLAILMLLSQLPSTFSIALTRFISQFYAQEDFGKIKRTLFLLGKRVLLIGFFIFLLLISFHKPLSVFLKIPNGVNFLLLSLIILFSYLSALPQATLSGLQKFWYISFSSIISGLIKLILVFVFIKLMLGVGGALGAFLLSSFLGLVLSFYFQEKSLSRTSRFSLVNDELNLWEMYNYLIPVFMVTLLGTAFLNIDIILVKRFFEPLQAGLYSISQVVGKIVFFFPSFIIMVMFPKVANLQAKNKDTRFILKKSLFYTFSFSSLVALIAIISPPLMLKILAGKVYNECFPLVRIFSLNMVLLSLLFVFMNYHLSLDERKYLYIFLGVIVGEIILISLFHKNLIQVLISIFICLFLLLVLNFYWVFHKPVKR